MRVASLKELDALVGMYLTKESPVTYWEEQHACFRFETLEEAEDALNDPYFQHFLPEEEGRSAAFVEVREFPPLLVGSERGLGSGGTAQRQRA